MPTSSISGLFSTSAYIFALMLLMVAVMTPALALYRDANVEAAGRLAQGLAGQLDDLSPGMKTVVEFGSSPGVDVAVTFSAAGVTATVDGFSATRPVGWPLASSTLVPGVDYEILLAGGVVTIA